MSAEPGLQGGLVVEKPPRDWQEFPWSALARREAVIVADEILRGRPRLFGLRSMAHVGFPPSWDTFAPIEGNRESDLVDLERHWTEYDPDSMGEDVKLLWETSRFGWAMDLARAHGWTGDNRYREAFVEGLRSWMRSNPPNQGPHWYSAQEVALRMLALVFAYEVMGPGLGDDTHVNIARFIVAHARRLPPTLTYSRAQGNNHLLAEATALLTAGRLLPEWPESAAWRKLGRRLLDRGLRGQIRDDGGYVQHSHNYARLALELGLWTTRLARTDRWNDRLARLAGLLKRMLSDEGRVSNLGPNDGAHLLPLTACGYVDFRPVTQLASALLGTGEGVGEGPWDELCYWFGTQPARPDPSPGQPGGHLSSAFSQAGLYLMEADEAKAIVRAAGFRSRPGHSDQLHFDLWWRGRNLAPDLGSYLYNGEGPWENGLAQAAVHNGTIINGQDPMERAGRFLWLRWSKARRLFHRVSSDGFIEVSAFDHDGYRHLGIAQRRTVLRVGSNLWLVIDDVIGGQQIDVTLGWALPDAPWRTEGSALTLSLDEGSVDLKVELEDSRCSLYREGEAISGEPLERQQQTWGWYSPTYAVREPALHWVHHAHALDSPVQVRSWWTCGPVSWLDIGIEWTSGIEGAPQLSTVLAGDSSLEL